MPILSSENEISFTCKFNSFSYEWLCTKTRFEEEAKGISEMAYYGIDEKRSLGISFRKELNHSIVVNRGVNGLLDISLWHAPLVLRTEFL